MLLSLRQRVSAAQRYMLPADFHLTDRPPTSRAGRCSAASRSRSWTSASARRRASARGSRATPVGEDGALARALVRANLAQPVPPAGASPPVSVGHPGPRPLDRAAAGGARRRRGDRGRRRVVRGDTVRREARPRARATCGARCGAGRERRATTAWRRRRHELVACIDSDCVPLPGWLDALLPHFADPELSAVAPRIVALHDEREVPEAGLQEARARGAGAERRARDRLRAALGRYERDHSPLDRGPDPARVVPYGRVPFVPGAALVVRRHLRFDPTLRRRGGRRVRVAGAVRALRAERPRRPRPPHRPGSLVQAPRLLRPHRGRDREAPPRQGAPAERLALDDRRVGRARGATTRSPPRRSSATATALTAREVDARRPRSQLAALGSLGPAASSPTRSPAPGGRSRPSRPRRIPQRAAAARGRARDQDARCSSRTISRTGSGSGRAASQQRTLDPLLPARPWKFAHAALS